MRLSGSMSSVTIDYDSIDEARRVAVDAVAAPVPVAIKKEPAVKEEEAEATVAVAAAQALQATAAAAPDRPEEGEQQLACAFAEHHSELAGSRGKVRGRRRAARTHNVMLVHAQVLARAPQPPTLHPVPRCASKRDHSRA